MRRAAVACAGILAGCGSVLGLDAPTLDPCLSGGDCVDAVADVTVEAGDAAASPDGMDAGDTAPEAAFEAGPEAAPACVWDGAVPAAGTGVRCGGGCNPVVFCTGATPVCCQTTSDAGGLAFACTSNEAGACGGYPIACVNENDCAGATCAATT